MLTDFKFWYIKKNDFDFITECAVRFFEGDITTKNEVDVRQNSKSVTRYRRFRKLWQNDLKHLGNDNFIKDANNQDAKLYTQLDFGNIKTDDELRLFCNAQLAKDPDRTPIDEQKWQV